jgi:hypothetical protein
MEATFDIIQDDPRLKGEQLEAEILLTVCQVMGSFPMHCKLHKTCGGTDYGDLIA